MTLVFQILLLAGVLAIFLAGPYLVSSRIAIVRGRASAGKAGRNAFGLRSEPRFYGLLAIFVAVLPATVIALVGLGVYVPQAEQAVTGHVIERVWPQPLGRTSWAWSLNLTFDEFLQLPSSELVSSAVRRSDSCRIHCLSPMTASRWRPRLWQHTPPRPAAPLPGGGICPQLLQWLGGSALDS